MNDEQLLRYSRQIMLPEFDIAGQEALARSRVLILGLGGLGSPVCMYLAAAGVGSLVLVDDDQVDLSNLQRQIAHRLTDIGRPKVESAAAAVLALNPGVQIETHPTRLSESQLQDEVGQAQAVVDCSDNFATRFMLNRACVMHGVPLVSGAAIRFEGQLSIFDTRQPESPCYRCLYDDSVDDANLTCSESGVIAPLVGVVGAMQALETVKLLSGVGTGPTGRLMLFDAMNCEWRTFRLRRDPKCPECNSENKALQGSKSG